MYVETVSLKPLLDKTNLPTVERVLAFLYFGDYQSPEPVPRSKSDQPLEPNELREGADATYVEAAAFERADELQNDDAVAIETDHRPIEEASAPEPEPEPSPAAVEDGEGEDLELQKALLESHSVRPLTPLGRCVGFPTIETVRKTAGGYFNGENFPYLDFSYQAPLLAHAEVYAFAKYHHLPSLQRLALQRMTQTLRNIDCAVNHAQEELAEVVQFVYNHIPAGVSDEEPMLKLLSQFAAINYTFLLHGSFAELVGQGGDFTLSLARKLSRRLAAHGATAELEGDALERRIEALESQVREKDETIRTLNGDINDAWSWAGGLNRKGGKRR
jgi:hypothetical protein